MANEQSLKRCSLAATLVLLAGCTLINQVSSSSPAADFSSNLNYLDSAALQQQLHGQRQSQQAQLYAANFDASPYKSVHELIKNHPDLREVSLLFRSD